MKLADICKEAHRIAREHGWDDPVPSIPEQLCLIHSEVSEALEEYRSDIPTELFRTRYTRADPNSLSDPSKPEGLLSELADVVIRVGHFVDLHGQTDEFMRVLIEKMAYNESRPYRHGNKRC